MWVRLPPRAPVFLDENELVNAACLFVYFARTLRFKWIPAPRSYQVCFQLTIHSSPGRWMPFTSSNLRGRLSKYHMGRGPKMGIVVKKEK
jgi:hypothetical protein